MFIYKTQLQACLERHGCNPGRKNTKTVTWNDESLNTKHVHGDSKRIHKMYRFL